MSKNVATSSILTPSPYSEDAIFDSRVVERHIAEGRTTQEAYTAYLKSLPDETEEVIQSDLRFHVRGRPLATAGYEEDES